MRVINLQSSYVGKTSAEQDIGQKQMAATNAALNFLKGKLPEMVPMLSNPTTRGFLVKFLDILTTDPSVLAGFRNSLQTINTAMKSDASGSIPNAGAV